MSSVSTTTARQERDAAEIKAPVQRQLLPVCASNPLQFSRGFFTRPGREPVFDMHYAVEVGVVRRGHMRRFYNGLRQDCGPGDVWFCGMLEPHGMQVMRAPCEVFVFVAWPPMLNEIRFPEAPALNWMAPFLVPPGRRPRAAAAERREALRLISRFLAGPDKPEGGRRVLLRLSLLGILLPFALRAGPEAERAGPEPFSPNRIAPVLNLLDGCRERISMDCAARLCGISRDTFAREFHSLMGLSFVQFNLRQRLAGAAGALATGDTPVKAIARDWGFTDSSHLDRLFTRQYGCHPQQYRDRNRK